MKRLRVSKRQILTLIFWVYFVAYLPAQQPKHIELLNADELIFQKEQFTGREYKRLIGHVKFKHESDVMTCDSAWFFSNDNTMYAFSNVHISQGDSLNLYADYLEYDGNTRVSRVRNHIRLVSDSAILYTDSLDFFRNENLAKYYGGGKIIHGGDTLTSRYGYYFSISQDFVPVENVVMKNDKFILYTDSGRYNASKNISYFETFTKFATDSVVGYCHTGWYDVQNNLIFLGPKSKLETKQQWLKGDSLFYNLLTHKGVGYRNTVVSDTVKQIILKGNNVFFDDVAYWGRATDSALLIQVDEQHDSLFLHADTLTLNRDSLNRQIIKAYMHVRFYKTTLQGKCDSMILVDDTLTTLYGAPVLWSQNQQISAGLIKLYSDSGQMKKMELFQNSFMVERQDSGKFNQVKGLNMVAWFVNNVISKVNVLNRAESIYYMIEDNTYKGINKVKSHNMTLIFKDGKINRVVYAGSSKGKFYPVEKFPIEEAYLKGFYFDKQSRPIDKNDIFRR